ncbi:MAG: glycosyltransferase family 2 protein [Bacteroidaceae bacterium]|nr:glycosyltransferase family 2 protein [Bacteroidaceae bacterium]
MAQEPFVSFIIPCYNVPMQSLQTCVGSLLSLTPQTDLEVLVVDDGSQRDEVVPWVESLRLPRVRAVRQENSGPGGARNTGIAHTTGTYIAFVDADDYILHEPQAMLLRLLGERRPDILAQGCPSSYEGTASDYLLRHDICPSCCSYFIKRSTLGSLRFTPHIYHEDEEFCTRLHLLEASLIAVNYTSYCYLYRSDSITHNKERAHLHKRYADYAKVLTNLRALPSSPALDRRLRIMAMCYLLTLMQDTPDHAFLTRHLQGLADTGLYPLPLRWHGPRYATIAFATRHRWAVRCLAPLVRLLMRLHHATHQRAFTPLAHPADAADTEIFGSPTGR